MDPIVNDFNALTEDAKRSVHLSLCKHALGVWQAFVNDKANRSNLRYVDTVVGMPHRVDRRLPGDAIRAVEHRRVSRRVAKRYLEPMTAMMDDDLEFPLQIEYAYYAIYNLYRKYCSKENVDDWDIIELAVSVFPELEDGHNRFVELVSQFSE